MTERPSRPRDPNQLAKFIADIATGDAVDTPPAEKAPGQVKGGKIGGKARAEKLTPQERSEIAKKAAKARWQT
ncbi:MAG: histone H1 [Brevundimonas sp.]|nr:histone H1 [Brevundimonas sp.]